MSLLKSRGPMSLDWSKGLTFWAVMHTVLQRDRIILDFGRVLGPRVSIGFDEEGFFTARCIDADEAVHVARILPHLAPLKPALVLFELAPIDDQQWKAVLEIDGEVVTSTTFRANFDVRTDDNVQTMGGDLESGGRNAAFTIASLGLVHGPVSAADKRKLLGWARQQFGLVQ